MNEKAMHKAVMEHFKPLMPADVEKQGRLANWDLWSGPINFCEECGADHLEDCSCEVVYAGFTKACGIVSDWLDENVNTLYWLVDCENLSTEEPQGEEIDGEYCEPEGYYVIDRKDVVNILFGKDLNGYV